MDKVLKNIKYVPIKKKSHGIYHNNKKIVFNTPPMLIPFGIEEYNDKMIMNLEFINYEKGMMKRFYDDIVKLDNYFKKINTIENHENIIKLENKEYKSMVKIRNNFPPHLRVHLKKNKNMIITKFYSNEKEHRKYETINKQGHNNYYGKPLSYMDIKKGDKCIAEIELTSIWNHEKSYGLLFSVKKIIII